MSITLLWQQPKQQQKNNTREQTLRSILVRWQSDFELFSKNFSSNLNNLLSIWFAYQIDQISIQILYIQDVYSKLYYRSSLYNDD